MEELRPMPLVDQAAARLRQQIADGHWPLGTKLPGETTLARTMGVGRSTVREAVRALAGAGMVATRHGVGVFVTATTPREDLTDKIRHAAISDLYEVRALIEIEAARLAALRRTPHDVTALRGALERRRSAAAGSNADFVDADIALHATVVAAAHNTVLTALFDEFVPALRTGLLDLIELANTREADRNPGDSSHSDLVDAIIAGRPDSASAILHAELAGTLSELEAEGLPHPGTPDSRPS